MLITITVSGSILYIAFDSRKYHSFSYTFKLLLCFEKYQWTRTHLFLLISTRFRLPHSRSSFRLRLIFYILPTLVAVSITYVLILEFISRYCFVNTSNKILQKWTENTFSVKNHVLGQTENPWSNQVLGRKHVLGRTCPRSEPCSRSETTFSVKPRTHGQTSFSAENMFSVEHVLGQDYAFGQKAMFSVKPRTHSQNL